MSTKCDAVIAPRPRRIVEVLASGIDLIVSANDACGAPASSSPWASGAAPCRRIFVSSPHRVLNNRFVLAVGVVDGAPATPAASWKR